MAAKKCPPKESAALHDLCEAAVRLSKLPRNKGLYKILIVFTDAGQPDSIRYYKRASPRPGSKL